MKLFTVTIATIISSFFVVYTSPIYNTSANESLYITQPTSITTTSTHRNSTRFQNNILSTISPTASTKNRSSVTISVEKDHGLRNVQLNQSHCIINSTNSTASNCTNKSDTAYRYSSYYLFLIGGISTAAFPINFLIIVHLCCKKKFRVVELFGVNLAAFNLLLATFGIAMATYLSQEYQTWSKKFCQGFTSVKLFSMGVNVWTLILLSYYYAVTGNGPNVERDALFKGIVYIFEGLMLSGVFAIMAWIKLDKWNFLCTIIEPQTTVDLLLTGIECSFYIILLLLIIRYPYHLFKRYRNPKDYPDVRDAPIFLIVFTSCVIWACGFLLTLPKFNVYSSFNSAAVARMCILLLPTLIQPFLFILRNTWICTGRNPFSDKAKKRSKDKEAQHVCDCSGRETCSDCEPEYEPDITYDEKTLLNKQLDNANNDIEKTKKALKKNKKRKTRFRFPRAICRSPNVNESREGKDKSSVSASDDIDKDDIDETTENTRLLKESFHLKLEKKAPMADYEDSPGVITGTKISEFALQAKRNNDKESENETLNENENNKSLEEEGRISRGPTFYPFVENKVKKRKKSSDSKKTPTKKFDDKENPPVSDKKDVKVEKKESRKSSNSNEPKVKKEKKKKRKSKKQRNEKHELDKHESVVSLEWDHYSDSSNSSTSGEKINDQIIKDKKVNSDNGEVELTNMTSVDLTSNSDNANSDNNSLKNDRKIPLRDLKSAQSCDWEPYSVDESCSSRTSSANKSPEYSPPHSIDNADSKTTNGNAGNTNNKKPSKNIKDDFILEEEG